MNDAPPDQAPLHEAALDQARLDQPLVTRIVEAALLASNQPLTVVQLHALFPLDAPAPDGSVTAALATLQAGSRDRGVELVEVASGWRFQVAADVHPWVARLWTERQTKYTRATLETLALVAYRQPITRGEIEQVRGVAVSSNIIKALEEREWIRVVGHRDIPGRPELLGTTRTFLDYFGLRRLDDLPPLSELKDFAELDPQFRFDGSAEGGALPVGDVAANDALPERGDDAATAADGGTDTGPTPHDSGDLVADDTTPRDDGGDAAADAPTPPAADAADASALADDGDSTGARHD